MRDISSFMSWFITQFVTIGTFLINWLDKIKLIGNASLLDFTITITVITAFIGIIITAPNLGVVQREVNKQDRKARRESKKKGK